MDQEHEQNLQRILQNRRNRGVSQSQHYEPMHDASSLPPQQQHPSSHGLRAPSPAARFPAQSQVPNPSAASALIPSLSYRQPGRSTSAAQAPAFHEHGAPDRGTPTPPSTAGGGSAYEPQQPYGAKLIPSAAAYENVVPNAMPRGGSMIRNPSAAAIAAAAAPRPSQQGSQPQSTTVPQSTGVPARGPSVDALLRRGTFDNFRANPILVSTNIRSYAAGAPSPASPQNTSANITLSTPQMPQQRQPQPLQQKNDQRYQQPSSYVPQRAPPPPSIPPPASQDPSQPRAQSPRMSAVAAATFSKPNPFRSQTFDDFVEAPHYDRSVSHDVAAPQMQRQGQKNGSSNAIMAMSPQRGEAPPLYDPQQSIAVLTQGDWFLKWTRIESAHRRYVWLDLGRGVISWAKSRDSSFFLQKSIKLEDVMDLQPVCTVDEASGRNFYQLVVVSMDRILKIGTELRDKFDVWFDTLQRLCEAQRIYTNTYIGRHAATSRLKPPGDYTRRPVGASDATE